jgi:arylsulfatase A-like enzyme
MGAVDSDEWITNVDWASTFVDIAGASPARVLDGRSLLYDLELDPQQVASLHASTAPFRIEQMTKPAARLAALRRCAGDECRKLEE